MSLEDVLRLVPAASSRWTRRPKNPSICALNGKLVARGEVVLVDDTYGLRITQIVDAAGRIESLR